MTLNQLIQNLNGDLAREYGHWHFYMAAAVHIQGRHREEYKEHFLEEAKGEMQHIHEFGKLIMGLGGLPVTHIDFVNEWRPKGQPGELPFSSLLKKHQPKALLAEALRLEEEVVGHFVERMDEAEELERNGGQDKIDGRYVHIFLEDQILDSRGAVDELRQLLK